MHYGDEKQLEENRLTITIYKHGIMGVDETNEPNSMKRCDVVINSIQECKYISPFILTSFFNSFQYIMWEPLLKDLKEEEWFQVSLRFTGYHANDVEVINVENISNNKTDFQGLH